MLNGNSFSDTNARWEQVTRAQESDTDAGKLAETKPFFFIHDFLNLWLGFTNVAITYSVQTRSTVYGHSSRDDGYALTLVRGIRSCLPRRHHWRSRRPSESCLHNAVRGTHADIWAISFSACTFFTFQLWSLAILTSVVVI